MNLGVDNRWIIIVKKGINCEWEVFLFADIKEDNEKKFTENRM